MQVDDGVFVAPLPEDDKDQRHGGDHAQHYDEVRFEPVFALSFVEDHLQRSQSDLMGSLWRHSQKPTKISDTAEITLSTTMKCDSNQSSRCPLSRTTCSVPSPI